MWKRSTTSPCSCSEASDARTRHKCCTGQRFDACERWHYSSFVDCARKVLHRLTPPLTLGRSLPTFGRPRGSCSGGYLESPESNSPTNPAPDEARTFRQVIKQKRTPAQSRSAIVGAGQMLSGRVITRLSGRVIPHRDFHELLEVHSLLCDQEARVSRCSHQTSQNSTESGGVGRADRASDVPGEQHR